MMLVTGARGAVGSYVPGVFSGEELVLTDAHDLDITDAAAVRDAFRRLRPQRVLHLAGATDVERCEREPGWTERSNVAGTKNIAEACREADAALVLLSTGMVFDGRKEGLYVESDAPAPPSVYGRSKLAGEEDVRRLVPRHLIVRAGWMIGGGVLDRKFVMKILGRMAQGQPIQAVSDQWGTLTHARQLLDQIRALLDRGHTGLFHAVNRGAVTRFDVARETARLVASAVPVSPIPAATFPTAVPRVRNEALRNLRLEKLGLERMTGWKDALAEYIGELRDHGLLNGLP
ncbi:MAG: hypothetical protein A2X36_04365 [Elusimicrobia bacterium GWA2_69_24]|nr:MAG: hypothetical protein A2X36_04365 [Elusimicrobia bacterium GWA2_69_24]HBL17009.1 hypothetical protein [Elusimicrobiota bacterium]